MRMSQLTSQQSPPSQAVESTDPANTITYNSMVTPSTEKVRPVSTISNNVSLLAKPYHPERSASITDRPVEIERVNPSNQEAGYSAWYKITSSRTFSQGNLCFNIVYNTELLNLS